MDVWYQRVCSMVEMLLNLCVDGSMSFGVRPPKSPILFPTSACFGGLAVLAVPPQCNIIAQIGTLKSSHTGKEGHASEIAQRAREGTRQMGWRCGRLHFKCRTVGTPARRLRLRSRSSSMIGKHPCCHSLGHGFSTRHTAVLCRAGHLCSREVSAVASMKCQNGSVPAQP